MDKDLRAFMGMTRYENAYAELERLTGQSKVWIVRTLFFADINGLSYEFLIAYLKNGGVLPNPPSIKEAYRQSRENPPADPLREPEVFAEAFGV